jgi:hypothetical protein
VPVVDIGHEPGQRAFVTGLHFFKQLFALGFHGK